MNRSIVVASSVGHGPCGAAHIVDAMGAIMVGTQLGVKADDGMLDATMDDYISAYDFETARVEPKDVSSNLVVVGGPGVNQVTWYYNDLRKATNQSSTRLLRQGPEWNRPHSCGFSWGIPIESSKTAQAK